MYIYIYIYIYIYKDLKYMYKMFVKQKFKQTKQKQTQNIKQASVSECDAIEAKSEASEPRGSQVFLYLASSPAHVVNARFINFSV